MNAQEQIQYWVEKCREVIQRQRLSYQTEKDYCGHLRRYFAFTTKFPKGFSPEEKAEKYLNYLASPQVDVSEATQSAAFFAILYFYKNVVNAPLKNIDSLRCKKRTRERTAPAVGDTHRLLSALPDVSGYPTNLQGRMLYARGLRVSEVLNLRLKDVRFADRKLVLIAAKGNKDRVVRMVPKQNSRSIGNGCFRRRKRAFIRARARWCVIGSINVFCSGHLKPPV